ncbi:MAG TPA: hypothetical protein VG013_33905 [Gemmataceae bacterium]|jgi:hypothetical protein|nr:hypothetical protein [Gemmataceae bacterium]
MTESQGESLPRTEHAGVRHEIGDADTHIILWTAGILVASAVVIHLVAWGLFVLFKEKAAKPRSNPMAVEESQRPIEERIKELRDDRHQPPLEGLRHYQSPDEFAIPGRAGGAFPASGQQRPSDPRPAEQARLHDYGQAEPPQRGFVRIPIDQAIDLVLRKELLPARRVRAAPPRTGLDTPTSSNSGRGPGGPPR